jgi:hypothetical protein
MAQEILLHPLKAMMRGSGRESTLSENLMRESSAKGRVGILLMMGRNGDALRSTSLWSVQIVQPSCVFIRVLRFNVYMYYKRLLVAVSSKYNLPIIALSGDNGC